MLGNGAIIRLADTRRDKNGVEFDSGILVHNITVVTPLLSHNFVNLNRTSLNGHNLKSIVKYVTSHLPWIGS